MVLINGVGLLGFRDPCGIRPLCFGYQKDANGRKDAYAIASESVGIDAISQNFVLGRDVAPGHIYGNHNSILSQFTMISSFYPSQQVRQCSLILTGVYTQNNVL